jgi:hypothetical protein
MKRAIFDLILFVSVFITPWWVVLIMALVGMFVFENFYEFVLASVMIYALYTVPRSGFITSPLWFPFVVSIVYIFIQFLKRRIILYK